MRRPNFARLNHILIPATKEGRDHLRSGWFGNVAWSATAFYGALTEEGRVVALLAVLVGGFAFDVRNTEIYLLWGIFVAALVASALARPLYGIGFGARVELTSARRVSVGSDLVFDVTIHNESERDLHALRVSGPFLPWDGIWAKSRPGVSLVRRGESARVELRARFVSRGEHHLDPFRVGALVPLGLARGRAIETIGARFLVLPRIARVSRLTLPRGRREQTGGVALASRRGDSMELLGVRPYRPGDSVRRLHARSWARAGIPIVREYEEELFRRVAVVVALGSSDEACVEGAISLAAGVIAYLARGDWLIDLLVTGKRVETLTLGRSLGFLEQALELLACVEPAPEPEPGLMGTTAALLAQLTPSLSHLSSLILIDAGAQATEIVSHLSVAGIGCAWLRVKRGAPRDERASDPSAPLIPAQRDGCFVHTVRPEAIEREELLL